MKHQAAIQKLLMGKLVEAQTKNPSYSLRAFAKRSGLSPASVSLILNGKRPVSKKLALKISEKLLLSPQERADLISQFSNGLTLGAGAAPIDHVDPNYLQLTTDHFRMLSEWYYFAILSLMKTSDFVSDTGWVAERLGISQKEAASAFECLKRLGLVTEGRGGKWVRSPKSYKTSDDVRDLSVQKAHSQSLELARRSIANDPVEARDFTSLTLAINPKRMAEAKEMIRRFQDQFDDRMETREPNRSEVYRLCVQFFPMTRVKNKAVKKGSTR